MKNTSVLLQWHLGLTSIIIIAAMVFCYYSINGLKENPKSLLFWFSIFFFVIAENSPLHYLGMHQYFSAHMISHIVLLLICGPLFVLSLNPGINSKKTKKLSAFIGKRSLIGWLAGVGIMWFWHIPSIFNAVFSGMNMGFSLVAFLHTASLLVAGVFFAWPIFNPYNNYRVHPLAGIVYLFTACISCSLLGLLITFAPLSTYHQHFDAGVMHMVSSNPWNLTAEADQQAAGLIMWVPCCFVYLSGCLFLLQRWFAADENISKPKIVLNPKHSHE